MNKKTKVGIVAAALALTVAVPGLAFANGGFPGKGAAVNGGCAGASMAECSAGYVDADGDGVCDNRAEGNGLGNGAGNGNGNGYVDADGDGVCDNRAEGNGLGNGTGAGFVDSNSDGVCDNQGTGRGTQRGFIS